MLKYTWIQRDIVAFKDLENFRDTFNAEKPKLGAFDSETNGLHIISCTPFLLVFGFLSGRTKTGYTYAIDLERVNPKLIRATILTLTYLFAKLHKVFAWNAKFDMHMMTNFGYPYIFKDNISDALIYVRLGHDALSKKYGGVPMRLKDYAARYITSDAKDHQHAVTACRTTIARENTAILKKRLAELPREEHVTMELIHNALKDSVEGMESLPPKVRDIVEYWLKNVPDPDNFQNLDRATVTKYAHYDVIFTLEAVIDLIPVIAAREQESVVKREEELIIPLYEMERVGFKFDRAYALESKQKLHDYIVYRRNSIRDQINQKIKSSQQKVIKEILARLYGMIVESTSNDALLAISTDDPDAKRFITQLLELRTLESWYTRYILNLLVNETKDGRVYTSINQMGTVSGRVSSDFQQFPSDPILDDKGVEIFHARRMFLTEGKPYSSIFYLDYSQIELRFQAIYTLFVSGGDLNLCRAYMPFRCFRNNGKSIELFDYKNPAHVAAWNSGEWYYTEEPTKKWIKTDLHSATTHRAFPELDMKSDEFLQRRHTGKTTNFACNYGANEKTLMRDMHFPEDVAIKLYRAYCDTFPEIKKYRNYVYRMLESKPYVENLFGRRYYGANGHDCGNYLVQGSAADFLKMKMIEVQRFLKEGNYKTKFQMNIHDEISFIAHDDEMPDLMFKIKKIMEDIPGTYVPIVAEPKITYTSWDKQVAYGK